MRILIDAPERIIIIADKRMLALFNTMRYTAKCRLQPSRAMILAMLLVFVVVMP